MMLLNFRYRGRLFGIGEGCRKQPVFFILAGRDMELTAEDRSELLRMRRQEGDARVATHSDVSPDGCAITHIGMDRYTYRRIYDGRRDARSKGRRLLEGDNKYLRTRLRKDVRDARRTYKRRCDAQNKRKLLEASTKSKNGGNCLRMCIRTDESKTTKQKQESSDLESRFFTATRNLLPGSDGSSLRSC